LAELPDEVREHFEDHPELWKRLRRLSGLKRGVSKHPAGVIIAPPELNVRSFVPQMYLASSKKMCGQYDLDAAEAMGLMKQDFLSLRTLETIEECVRMVGDLDPDSWVPDEEPDDDKVYAMLAKGETAGVFQMEGSVNTAGIQAIQPACFEDIVSCTSLYRTGPIQAGFPKVFLENRKGDVADIQYVHPALKPILERTWGVVLYQEQVMAMGEQLAGFTMAELDDIKVAVAKKRSSLMQSLEPKFIDGVQRVIGASRKQAKAIWAMIESYSGYSYNRSHAVAYTFLTYQTARLKCLYPAEYAAALLRTVKQQKPNVERRRGYVADATKSGLKVHPPEVNVSGDVTKIVKDTHLLFGFTDIAGVGPAAAKKLVDRRPDGGYSSLEEVEEAVNNIKVMGILAQVGALRRFGVEPDRAMQSALLGWEFAPDRFMIDGVSRRKEWSRCIVMPSNKARKDHVCLFGRVVRVSLSKTRNGDPYMTMVIRWDQTHQWTIRLWQSTKNLWPELEVGALVCVEGEWERTWENVSVQSSRAVTVLAAAPKPKEINDGE
jgi:DNA polymerase-3 subunit alpha